jgi:hypothetical protein
MDEHEPQKLDLNDESGVTRREVLRRGAIVGGTLLWVAPAIQSISQKAFAASGGAGSASTPSRFRRCTGVNELRFGSLIATSISPADADGVTAIAGNRLKAAHLHVVNTLLPTWTTGR